MGRPREFDRDEVLDKAMQVFWTRGYDAPTMTELKDAMGIGRQSLYDTFGDKKQLFEEALDRYLGQASVRNSQVLGDDDGLRGIRNYVNAAATELAGPRGQTGCLMFNTCTQVAPRDPEIAAQVGRGLADLRRSFEGALRRAAEQGTLGRDRDVKGLALFLASQIAGLTVLAQAGASKRELRAVAKAALGCLE